jgi:Na+/melibiose symporter-like transporter
MMHYFVIFKDWVISLGEKHDVNPLLLGSLYFIGKLTMVIFIGVTIKKLKEKKPVILTMLLAAVGYSIPYTYLIIYGRNLSVWVYVFVGVMLVFGGFTIWKKINAKPGVDAI